MAESQMKDDIAQEAPMQSSTEWRDSQMAQNLVELLEDSYQGDNQE